MDVSNLESSDWNPNFRKCILCQQTHKDKLIDPSKCKNKEFKGNGYKSLADSLIMFEKHNQLENSNLKRLTTEHGENLETYLQVNEVKWHRKCRLKLSSLKLERLLKKKPDLVPEEGLEHDSQEHMYALNQLIESIKNRKKKSKEPITFKLSKLHEEYLMNIDQGKSNFTTSPNITRFKNELMSNLCQLIEFKYGRDIYVIFRDDLGSAIMEGKCSKSQNSPDELLEKAANMLRNSIINENKSTIENESDNVLLRQSVPLSVNEFISQVLRGTKVSKVDSIISIAQLIMFNTSRKQKTGEDKISYVSHPETCETPLAIYIGLLLHAHYRDRQIIEKFAKLGLCIGYHRVLTISSSLGNKAVRIYQSSGVVFPLNMERNVFTTAQVDNIDHDPQSTNAMTSFHGTGISILQHPTDTNKGLKIKLETDIENQNRTVEALPAYFTDVHPFSLDSSKLKLPATTLNEISNKKLVKEVTSPDKNWLDHVEKVLKNTDQDEEILVSWSAYHASNCRKKGDIIVMTKSGLLPLFREPAHTIAMMKHSVDMIMKTTEFLNPGQCPVVHADQPLYALLKQLQFFNPGVYGEKRLVVMMGGMHIEMLCFSVLGDLLEGSGWSTLVNKAGITTSGRAESLLTARHITRTRRTHQVTAAVLHTLQQESYDEYAACVKGDESAAMKLLLSMEEWKETMLQQSPQFFFWDSVLQLELLCMMFVRSIRTSDFNLYVASLIEIAPFVFAFDHTNYMRWLPVHIKDMMELEFSQPEVFKEFMLGNFTAKKTLNPFSAMAEDQSHEQNNAKIKGDGGAVGLTENAQALRRWMVAGPEVSRTIDEFEQSIEFIKSKASFVHHEESAAKQVKFRDDVVSLREVFKEHGNPFSEEGQQLYSLDTREVPHESAVKNLHRLQSTGEEKFVTFVQERLIHRTVPLDAKLVKNRLSIFSNKSVKSIVKEKNLSIKLVKQDELLFRRMLIACQNREPDMIDFFSHENQPFPPSLSQGGRLRHGTKSDLLNILETNGKQEVSTETSSSSKSVMIVDGAFITQVLKPQGCKNVEEYAVRMFIPHVKSYFKNVERVDVVWDRYDQKSVKNQAREERGQGTRRKIVSSTPIPADWQKLLRVNENKTELFSYLSNVSVSSPEFSAEDLIVNILDKSISSNPMRDMSSFSNCNHEEADTRIFNHLASCVNEGILNINIRTGDTDVVVLAINCLTKISQIEKLYVHFGTGKNFRVIDAISLSKGIGPMISKILPLFHSFTGCDTVSSFAGKGKKTAWSVMKTYSFFAEALERLTENPNSYKDPEILSVIERYCILLYDRTSSLKSVNDARRKLFPSKAGLENIPPTQDALIEHLKRALYQGIGVVIWGNMLETTMTTTSPTDWGWSLHEEQYVPVWTVLPDMWKSTKELIFCNCKSSLNLCGTRCKCRNADPPLPCTGLCNCEGSCLKN